MIIAGVFSLLFFSCTDQKDRAQSVEVYKPWESLGELFRDVQMSGIFSDSKTFVDCTPRYDPERILSYYQEQQGSKNFSLKTFIADNFEVPSESNDTSFITNKSLADHIEDHWDNLTRDAEIAIGPSTLIDLPHKYIVPGGRFREIYYWDSYFTMVGLGASGKLDLFRAMLDNFSYLIDEVGFIPNGNRTYYLSRSQPPFFSSMVNTYIQLTSIQDGLKYLPAIQKEYDFWMSGSDQLSEDYPANRRVVLFRGSVLNRYWDDQGEPRPESYREDIELADHLSDEEKPDLYRELRAGAESGWDYSSRWFADPQDFKSIRITSILPVDLNCLMYAMETTLSSLYEASGNYDLHRSYLKKAEERYNALNTLFWNEQANTYQDILWEDEEWTGHITAASFYPMYFKAARKDYADRQMPVLLDNLLSDGGLLTTVHESDQQWDNPNGWAPLQWIAIKGLEHYGWDEQAEGIRDRWIRMNRKVYLNTGKMMEKYNVVDTTLLAGGGEYPTQDGFGWTNGVYLALVGEGIKY